MPRNKPPEGKAHIVVGIKTQLGFRIEFDGEVDEKVATDVFKQIPGFENMEFEKSA